jgi:hypothetical protein
MEIRHVGRRLQDPTQTVEGWTKCFCGAAIDNKSSGDHIYACHMEVAWNLLSPAPTQSGGRLEIANTIEPVQDGCIHIEKQNAPFLKEGSPAEYGAGLQLAIDRGWL